jgi:prephenate dehydrogenase
MTDEDGFFKPISETTVAIVGLGLIGGSLAMALHGACKKLIGCDTDWKTIKLAREMRIVDEADTRVENVLPEAEVVILATPVRTILQMLTQLPFLHPGNAVILDTGSTKVQIVQAMNQLPERFDPLGGHPICGKEKGTLEAAEATLFTNATFVLTPLARTTKRASRVAQELLYIIGAQAVWMNAETHDTWTAATSHMPYLISNALAAITPDEAAVLIGPGFRSMTRIAATPPSIMLDILLTNKENILKALAYFRQQLDLLETLLQTENTDVLNQKLLSGANHQKQLLQHTT